MPERVRWLGVAVDGDGTVLAWSLDSIFRLTEKSWCRIARLPDEVARRRFPDNEMIVSVSCAEGGGETLVLVNPFRIYRMAKDRDVLVPFHDGMQNPAPAVHGIPHLARVGDSLVVASFDGMYLRRVGDQRWSGISTARRSPLATEHIRDVARSPWRPDAWICADARGLREETKDGVTRIWESADAQSGLIANLAVVGDAIIAGLYRATVDTAGIVFLPDGQCMPIKSPSLEAVRPPQR